MTQRMPPTQVLVVDDEEPVRRLLRKALEAEGYSVAEAGSAAEAEAQAAKAHIDLFLLDLGLPDRDGIDLIRGLRAWTQRPILVLSRRSQEHHKVEALDAGADDYLTKPFGVAELHARLRVALRHAARASQPDRSALSVGDVRIDLEAKTVSRGAQAVRLTATEWRLLEALAKRSGQVVASRQLLREVWGPGRSEQGHYLRIYVRQLRRKLEAAPAAPRFLLTETGIGYRLLTGPPAR